MSYSKIHVTNGENIPLNNSKSLLIRILIANVLYRDVLPDIAQNESEDVKTVHHCLRSIRDARHRPKGTTVAVNANECGTGYRFLLSVLACTEGEWILTGSPRLRKRPIRPLVSALLSIGADIEECDCGLRIHGHTLQAKEMTIHCEESSQFASSLILISHRIGLQQLHILPPVPPSMPYINMTRSVVNAMLGERPLPIEADWSTAAFWYAMVACSGQTHRLLLQNLRLESWQGDSIVAELFARLGVSSKQTDGGIVIEKHTNPSVQAWKIDLTDHPDLAPVLAATAALYPFDLTLRGIDNLNFKESNRIDILTSTLAHFAPTAYHSGNGEESLKVEGTRRYEPEKCILTLNTWNDHRMVMAFALLSMRYYIHLSDTHCVRKSYPEFENYLHTAPPFQK